MRLPITLLHEVPRVDVPLALLFSPDLVGVDFRVFMLLYSLARYQQVGDTGWDEITAPRVATLLGVSSDVVRHSINKLMGAGCDEMGAATKAPVDLSSLILGGTNNPLYHSFLELCGSVMTPAPKVVQPEVHKAALEAHQVLRFSVMGNTPPQVNTQLLRILDHICKCVNPSKQTTEFLTKVASARSIMSMEQYGKVVADFTAHYASGKIKTSINAVGARGLFLKYLSTGALPIGATRLLRLSELDRKIVASRPDFPGKYTSSLNAAKDPMYPFKDKLWHCVEVKQPDGTSLYFPDAMRESYLYDGSTPIYTSPEFG
jgi:hypothetical protein